MANACPHRCSVGFLCVIVACIVVVLVVIVVVIVVVAFR